MKCLLDEGESQNRKLAAYVYFKGIFYGKYSVELDMTFSNKVYLTI